MESNGNIRSGTLLTILGVFAVFFLFGIGMWGCPRYRVYERDLVGQSSLKQQEWEKKIKIEEARSNLEAQKLNALAEVERAKGVAEANKIIGDSLHGNEAYLRYLWIQGLQDGSSEVIYVPTEAGLPILEAGKRK